MKKNWNRIFALCLTLALVFSLAACGQKTDEPDEQQTKQQTENDTPAHYSIAALKGPTAMGLVKLMKDSENGETTGNEYTFTLAGSADEVTPALLKGELDMACVPANLAAVLYNKTEGEIEVLAVNTLGVLYIVENGESVQSIADLKGQTIVAAGKGSTPEYALRYLLAENGIDPDSDVTIDWKSEHSECVAALASGRATIAPLPHSIRPTEKAGTAAPVMAGSTTLFSHGTAKNAVKSPCSSRPHSSLPQGSGSSPKQAET